MIKKIYWKLRSPFQEQLSIRSRKKFTQLQIFTIPEIQANKSEKIFFSYVENKNEHKAIISKLVEEHGPKNFTLISFTKRFLLVDHLHSSPIYLLLSKADKTSTIKALGYEQIRNMFPNASNFEWISPQNGIEKIQKDFHYIDADSELTNTYSKKIAINIVDYESATGGGWILSTFAKGLQQGLESLGIQSFITSTPDQSADVIHHIPYLAMDVVPGKINSSMVTHIDSVQKAKQVQEQLSQGAIHFCMSSQTAKQIQEEALATTPSNIHVALPPAVRQLSTSRVVISIFSRLYKDGRKNENQLVDICSALDKDSISLRIQGSGWNEVIEDLRKNQVVVEYQPEFDLETYQNWLTTSDFVIYLGTDEGAMSFLDGLQAGKKVIVPPVGYHLDFYHPLVNYAVTNSDYIAVLEKEINLRKTAHNLINSVSWTSYGRTHLQVWESLLNQSQ